MNNVSVSRRRLLAALLGGSCATLASTYWKEAAAAETEGKWRLPDIDAADAASFSLFLALSQLVTLRPLLDEQVARRMHSLFLDEPWGPHHIQSTYAQLVEAMEQAGGCSKPCPSAANIALGKGQAWFAGHLLTTWYLGIYYHERLPPVRVAYAEALMFDAVRPWLPSRFSGHTGFGQWEAAPESPHQA